MLRQGWGGEGLEWRYVQAGERFGGQVLCVFFLGTSQPRYLRQFPCARFAGAA